MRKGFKARSNIHKANALNILFEVCIMILHIGTFRHGHFSSVKLLL